MIHSNHHREGIPHMTNQDYALTRDLLGAANGRKYDPVGETLRAAFAGREIHTDDPVAEFRVAFETNDENGIPA